jgi:O-antigen/teichoic acid export membrane protein
MALAGAMLLGGLVELIGSYWVHPYRPRISLERRDEMWGFSVGIIFSRAGSFLGKKVDQFVLANQVGTPAIGGYHVAGELATLATNEVVMPIRRALFPTLSSAMDRKEERNALVVGAMNAVALICIPMGVGMSFVAADVVPLLLGEQWVSAIPAMRWLALYGALSALVLGLELPLWVTKNIKKAAWLSWGEFLLLIPVTLMFTRFWGIEGAAIGRAATSLGIFVVMLYLVSREFGIDSGRLWAVIVNPLAASALMYLALHQLPLDAVSIRPVRLAASVLSGALLYGALILGWWKLRGCPDGMETRIVEFLAKARNKK